MDKSDMQQTSPTSSPPTYSYADGGLPSSSRPDSPISSLPLHTEGSYSSGPYLQPPGGPTKRPSFKSRPSLLDELLPVPSTAARESTAGDKDVTLNKSVRRIASVSVIGIFLISVVFLVSTASSTEQTAIAVGLKDLRVVFGGGHRYEEALNVQKVISTDALVATTTSTAPAMEETSVSDEKNKKPDFDQYKFLQTLSASQLRLSDPGRRVIFIGDIHGSYEPLQRLMEKLNYDSSKHMLVHVGDLIAKGSKHDEVLSFMRERRVVGVRGNHDQPVIQWRAWMQWAGGKDWEAWLESSTAGQPDAPLEHFKSSGKSYPDDWEWKGEHWHIARNIHETNYRYLLDLPLTLHLPSLHSIVVHAGLLSRDINVDSEDNSQPLIHHIDDVSTDDATDDAEALSAKHRYELERDLLTSIPQNQNPYNLINMRSILPESHEITKSSKVGVPWSEYWAQDMTRCTASEASNIESRRKHKHKKLPKLPKVGCAPVSVIYGHAAGRGLDIKEFSKGIDTGCVYGKKLTALVLGDIADLQSIGDKVKLGSEKGVLVSVDCGEGGI